MQTRAMKSLEHSDVSEGVLLNLEGGEGAEVLGISKDGVLRLILVVAADEGAVEARQGVHGWRGRVVKAAEEVTRRIELE